MSNKKGFTMVELLVVLVIIAILAAVATPIYLSNTKKSKMSEAVAATGLIRQALRDYKVNNNTYFDVTADHIQKPLPPLSEITLASGALATPANFGVDVDAGIPQYFSNAAYTIEAAGTGALPDTNGASNLFTNPPAVDFIIRVDGTNSVQCAAGTTTNCAIRGNDVIGGAGNANSYQLEMDNSGRTFVSYDNGTTWGVY